MRLEIKSRRVIVTPALTTIIEKKLRPIGKFFPQEATASVMLSVEKRLQTIEVTLYSGDTIIRSEASGADLYNCIDEVVDKLERQIIKNRTRLEKRLKTTIEFDSAYADEDDFVPQVVKTKRFAIKPMSVEEAILQMELLGHSFFVFTHDTTNQLNVIYVRKDGNYGLIEPDFD